VLASTQANLNETRRPAKQFIDWVSVSLVELARGNPSGLFFILTDPSMSPLDAHVLKKTAPLIGQSLL